MKDNFDITTYRHVFIIFLTCLFWGSTNLLIAQQRTMEDQESSSLEVGFASSKITPDPMVNNWVTGKPYGKVRDSIYTRALVLRAGDQKVVLLHWELVDAGESATEQVRSAVADALEIPSDHIMVNASHNHSAPWAPVYDNAHRGLERDTWWAVRYMPPQHEEPPFKAWMDRLISQSVAAAAAADRAREPATAWVGRADVSRYLQNRRPRPVREGIAESHMPDNYNYRHPEWDPNVLSGNRTFGPLDRAMTLVSFRSPAGNMIGTLFHLSCHAVSVYPYTDALSGDWPGAATRAISEQLGGPSMFLQGTAGDINPWRRGAEAVQIMAKGLAGYAGRAYRYSAQLQPGKLHIDRTHVGLPLTDYGRERTGLQTLPAEIQAVRYGSLAIVTLPGEPMTGLGMAIKERSPFPQTLVLGYSNGNGVHYVGMPGEKARGGYEVGEKTNLGTDRAGLIMVEAAEDLLHKMYGETE
ncbi:hypothetical protein SAMN05443144_10394 [Fodinibius roseus]|uniref:Neutral/alkaline non-lysosomal ceramidase, N-terminal n=1 Tax=Fodinibius roseus TaxID=1194090 RepID=A0A1M4W1T7_9BACT|nr:hypothetical protein [Fodinibius roseus]SHE75125.1 hypothetical protein SAMN05443144_10394 [Fodinibius roseus]